MGLVNFCFKRFVKRLFTKISFMFYLLILFFVSLWQKTRLLRSFFTSSCCFYPSCSDYFLVALRRHGLIFGLILFLKRLVRCHPLCKGGIDEVPMRGLGNGL